LPLNNILLPTHSFSLEISELAEADRIVFFNDSNIILNNLDSETLIPYGLICEYLCNTDWDDYKPVHLEQQIKSQNLTSNFPQCLTVDTPHPRLSWKLKSSHRGAKQTAFQIIVAPTEEDIDSEKNLLWNSSKRNSSETIGIEYTGKKLNSPYIKYIYGLLGKAELVENAHFPTEKHGYDYSKRAAVYPFLVKYLGLDLSKAMNPNGSLKEEGIVIEDQKALYPFDEKHPLPAKGIRNNDDVVWK
jgi:hypothetical protein